MSRHRIAALVVSAVVITLAAAAAQSGLGHIRGLVQDRAGRVLPGVEVRISPVLSETRGVEGRAGVSERKTITDAKGSSSFGEALALAQRFKGDDPHGHRAEFIRLIVTAEGVTRLRAAR